MPPADELQADAAFRTISSGEIDGILALHRLCLGTGRKRGARANLSSVDPSGLSCAGIRRAWLDGADFCRANSHRANLIGADRREALLSEVDLTEARTVTAETSLDRPG